MPTLITTTALGHTLDNNSRSYAVLPNGNLLTVIWKTTTTFAVYETSDRINFSLRGTFTTSVSYSASNPANRYAVELTHDGATLHVVYRCADLSVKHRAITVATWAATVEAAVYPVTTGIVVYTLDISVSQGGAVLVAMIYAGPTGDKAGYITRLRHTGGAWVGLEKVTVNTATAYKTWCTEISVDWYRNADSVNKRFALIWAAGLTTADAGSRLYHSSVNEATGASLSTKHIVTLPTGGITGGVWSNLSFTGPARRTLLRSIPGTLDRIAVGINSSKVVNSTIHDSLSAGIIKITTLGANAAADVVDSQMFSAPASYKTSALRGYIKAISVAFFADTSDLLFNFLNPDGGGVSPGLIKSRVMRINSPTSVSPYLAGSLNGVYDWDSQSTNIITVTQGGSDHTLRNIRHDFLEFSANGTAYLAGTPALAVASLRPTSGQVVTSSEPTVGGKAATPRWKESAPTFFVRYTVATDSGFTSNVIGYDTQERSYAPYTASQDGFVTDFSDVWKALPITPGSWYIQARVMDLYGNQSPILQNSGTFEVRHPGIATNVQPPFSIENPTAIAYTDPLALGYIEIPVSWTFSDAYPKDKQGSYKIQVQDPNSAVVYDSGTIVSANNNGIARVPFANKNQQMLISVFLADQYNTGAALGNGSGDQFGSIITYTPSDITAFAPTSVDGSGNVNTNAPNFSYTYAPGLYDVVSMELTIMKNGVPIYTGTAPYPATTGTFLTGSKPILAKDSDYTAYLSIVDANGLKGSKTIQIHTVWSAPPAPGNVAASASAYNTENGGYITVSWDNSTEVVNDFINYTLYRVVDQLDQNGVAISTGNLQLLKVIGDNAISYQYFDYFAPSNTRVGYVVTQTTNVFGSIIESINNTPTYITPVSDGYWLVDPTPEDPLFSAFKLSNVIDDGYSDQYEEEAIQIIGRGRHYDRGDHFGIEGSLTAQLRNTGSTTARVKKLRIEKIKREARSLFLRTPFGDSWYVNIGEVAVARLAGTGLNEFCDLTIPYSEVYN